MKKLLSFTLVLATLVCMLASCGTKTAQTPEGFTQLMENNGFTVQDVTAETETNGLASDVLIAENGSYQIEYYKLTDENTAAGVFENNKQTFETDYPNNVNSAVTIGNYSYYSFTSGDTFGMIARIADTMLYCTAAKTDKDAVVDIVKTLGYK